MTTTNQYEVIMSQAADKMTELYDKIKLLAEQNATLAADNAKLRDLLQKYLDGYYTVIGLTAAFDNAVRRALEETSHA